METSRQTGSVPAAAAGDTGVLTVVGEQFECLYDVPFICVNMINGRIVAEIERSDNQLVTLSRIQEAEEVARKKGQHLFARKLGDREYPELEGIAHGWITLHFTPDTDGDL